MSAPAHHITAPEAQQIEVALDALLTAIIAADRAKAARRTWDTDNFADIIGVLMRSPAERAAKSLIASPVGWACRTAVRTLGERLYEIGGLDLMSRVCDDVADMDAATSGYRLGVMDHQWDGIGRTGGSAGWCS